MKPLRLIKTAICPPDGFRYVFPNDGYVAHAWTYDAWLQEAVMHAQANNLPEPTAEEMETQLCEYLPPGWCNYDSPNRPRPSASISWSDVAEGGRILAAWLKTGMRTVDPIEAERRALICSRCHLNMNIEGCGSCHSAVQLLTQRLSTKYDFALKACAVCKCLLRAKVHAPFEGVLDKENETVQSMYPSFCWLNKTSENYRG